MPCLLEDKSRSVAAADTESDYIITSFRMQASCAGREMTSMMPKIY
jgi:hypothetical protein